MINTESFVFYESVYKQMEQLHKRGKYTEELELARAIINFGLYGEVPDEESDVWLYGFEQAATSISCAKDRYARAIENGQKGGRPRIMLDSNEVDSLKSELGTWKKVAEQLDVSENTLRNFRKSRGA